MDPDISNCGEGMHGNQGILTSHSVNLEAFYDVIIGWVDWGRAVDVFYLDFRKAFDIVSHNIIIEKLRKYGIDE